MATKEFNLSKHINNVNDQIVPDIFDCVVNISDLDIWNVHNSLPVQMFMWQRNYMLEMGYIGIYVVLRSHGLI